MIKRENKNHTEKSGIRWGFSGSSAPAVKSATVLKQPFLTFIGTLSSLFYINNDSLYLIKKVVKNKIIIHLLLSNDNLKLHLKKDQWT